MIYVYLSKYRSAFMELQSSKLFRYEEVFDIEQLSPCSDDVLVTDEPDIPELKCKILEITTKEDLEKILKLVEVQDICTSYCYIPGSTADYMIYHAKKVLPDERCFSLDLLPEEQEKPDAITITEPNIRPVIRRRASLKSKQGDLWIPEPIPDMTPELIPEPVRHIENAQPVRHIENAPPARHTQSGQTRQRINLGIRARYTGRVPALFIGASSRAGTSTIAYLTASRLAQMGRNVILLDLDITKPDLTRTLGVFNEDATLTNLAELSDADWMQNQKLLVSEVQTGDASFDFIGIGQISFADKHKLIYFNFTEKLNMLQDMYDHVIVDLGRVQDVMYFQMYLMSSNFRSLFIADGTSRQTLLDFIKTMNDVEFDYGIIINRLNKTLSPALLERHLVKTVIASFQVKNSVASVIQRGQVDQVFSDRLFLEGVESIVEEVSI